MTLPAPADVDIQRIVDLVVAEVQPLRVVLFGSRARGDHRPDSDIDLMVVMPEGVNRLHVAQKLYMIGLSRVDFVVTTPGKYSAARLGYGLVYRDIAREGLELYAA